MNLEFEKVKVYYDGEIDSSHKGKVVIEPLERGFARTLGNSLRRVMLSSMPGASAIGIKLPNVFHEFSSIPNAVTDMIELIMNLKEVDFDTKSSEVQVVKFKSSEQGLHTADSLELPEGLGIRNPEKELIKLTGEGYVEFEVYVKRSRGYVDASFHKDFEDRPDVIKIDGMFSPIKRVNFEDEQMRLGHDATYERLVLDIETNGSIEPKEAVDIARKILINHLGAFDEMSDIAEKTETFKEEKEEENRIMDMPIETMDLSVRAYNCLRRDGYTTVRKIYTLSETQLYAIHQMGDKSVKEVIAKMKELGFELRKD